jgi:hypothetical protein
MKICIHCEGEESLLGPYEGYIPGSVKQKGFLSIATYKKKNFIFARNAIIVKETSLCLLEFYGNRKIIIYIV